jgi:hypothetical protein
MLIFSVSVAVMFDIYCTPVMPNKAFVSVYLNLEPSYFVEADNRITVLAARKLDITCCDFQDHIIGNISWLVISIRSSENLTMV